MGAEGECFAGIDVGSSTTKVAVFDGCALLASSVADTPADGSEKSAPMLDALLAENQIAPDRLRALCATGYGRARVKAAHGVVSEITAGARGACFLAAGRPPRSVIDVGGEDTKDIRLAPDLLVEDFAMNDRCAAGAGRFLEVAAARFGLSVGELAALASSSPGEISVSSACAVFATSESAALLAEGVSPAGVAAGLHRSAARRIAALAHKLAIEGPVLFIGGGALNECLVKMLGEELRLEVRPAPCAQVASSLGAAIVAMDRYRARGPSA